MTGTYSARWGVGKGRTELNRVQIMEGHECCAEEFLILLCQRLRADSPQKLILFCIVCLVVF